VLVVASSELTDIVALPNGHVGIIRMGMISSFWNNHMITNA
jgi:hypothetical protein